MNASRSPLRVLLAAAAVAAAGLATAQPIEPAAPATAPAPGPEGQVKPPPVIAPTTPLLPPEELTAPPPSDTSASIPSSATPAPPPRRTLYTAAVIQVLDKVTADNLRFEAPLHKFIRYKGLIFLVNTCQSGIDDQPGSAAHLEIDSQPPAAPGRPANPTKLVFRGWMFTDTPGPHPFEHPVYDAWLVACKQASTP